jgi:hypothetical protein
LANNKQNFSLTAGEDVTLSMTARAKTGAVLNLTGATITWRMALTPRGPTLIEKTGSVVSAAAGTFTVSLTTADTDPSTFTPRNYYHQASVSIASAATVAVKGRILVEGGITA